MDKGQKARPSVTFEGDCRPVPGLDIIFSIIRTDAHAKDPFLVVRDMHVLVGERMSSLGSANWAYIPLPLCK